MTFVIPRWRAVAVTDFTALWVREQNGLRELNAATAMVLNYMPVIGITHLTSQNAGEVWCRIAIHQALLGGVVEEYSTGKTCFLTKDDILRNIGFETEGTEETFELFCAETVGRARREQPGELPSTVANGGRSMMEILGVIKPP
jgi:hypothetical protein